MFAECLVASHARRVHRSQAVRPDGSPVPDANAPVFATEDEAHRASRALFGEIAGRLLVVQPYRSPADALAMRRPR